MLNIEEFTNFSKINNIVLGGAGFIGSNLVDKLVNNGENVICIDNLSTGKLDNIKHLESCKNFNFIKHDILFPLSSKIPIEKIWHLASPASPSIYQENSLNTIRVIYEGTYNALLLARENLSKFLFASTSEVYGITKNNLQYESMPINLSTTSPRACYSESKRLAETLIRTFADKYNLDTKIARIFNTYGPRLSLKDGRVIGNFIKQSLMKEELTIYGDGLQTRSFCYIEDLIEGLRSLMESNYQYPLNLGSQEEISIIKLATLIKEGINPSLNFKFYSLPIDDPILRKPSIEKAESYLNWCPKISLKEGLNNTISFYKDSFKT